MIQQKKYGFVIAGILVLGVVLFGWKEYTRKNEPVKDISPAFQVSASRIIKEFEANDTLPAKKYNGRLISVNGAITNIDKDDRGYFTIEMKEPGSMSAVRCAMDTMFASELVSLQAGQAINVKGMFTGYQKDETGLLGSDIILNRCVVETTQTNKRKSE